MLGVSAGTVVDLVFVAAEGGTAGVGLVSGAVRVFEAVQVSEVELAGLG